MHSFYPKTHCIHDLFEAQTSLTPQAIAIEDGNDTYTYAQLNKLANQVARTLVVQGVHNESIVACYLGRSMAIVLYTLAILKAGGTYLLLDPNLPDQRLEYLVQDARPQLVLHDAPLPALAAQAAQATIATAELIKAARTLSTDNLAASMSSDDAAYVAYTSGSTGRPKGVIITHRATVNHSYAFSKKFGLGVSDRVPLMAPIAFDMATEEMIPPLMSGCTLVVSDSQQRDMAEFNLEIIARRYTILNIAAPLWHAWTAFLQANRLPIPPSIRLVITGSDKIYTKSFLAWKHLERADEVDWVAAYGTTETTVTSTFYTTAMQDDLSDEPCIPIGKPIANTSLYILDEQLRSVNGDAGGLYIGGDGLARGYLGLPEKTAECFIPDPFSDEPNARMYKTGDLARSRPDGVVVCLGRKDLQVKIFGLRVELGEIEAVLSTSPQVKQVIVVLQQPDQQEDHKQLVAFIVPADPNHFDKAPLKILASQQLHPHMVPRQYIGVASLPLNSNGKVDRKALEQYTGTYV